MIQAGNICVDVFLFISGYCCCLSFKKNPDIIHFYERRFGRLLIPYLILAIPFYLWKTITHFNTSLVNHAYLFFIDISGFSLWTNGTITTWFVTAIALFYIAFPFLYLLFNKFKSAIIPVLILISLYVLGMISIHSMFPGVYRHGGIALTRFPIFCLGAVCSYYSILPNPSKRVLLLSGVLVLDFLGICPIRGILDHLNATREFYWLSYILFTIPLTYVLYLFIRLLPLRIKGFVSFCGGISLELYIVHILIRNCLVWYSVPNRMGYWLYLFLPLISIPFAYFVSIVSRMIRTKLSV